jgi:hypothetical protein
MCVDCRKEFDDIGKILDGAGALSADVRKAMAEVDWDAFAERVAQAALEGRRERGTEAAAAAASARATRALRPAGKRLSFWGTLLSPRWRPAFAGALGGLLLGSLGMYLALKPGVVDRSSAAALRASGEFIDRAELSLARREALDYLGKSQALLLDFVQAEPEAAAQTLRSGQASLRARDLLAKKRYLNRELESVPMAKAREICDQIELLFQELAQLSDELEAGEAARIQKFIEDRNLLLRIQLVRKELMDSEV